MNQDEFEMAISKARFEKYLNVTNGDFEFLNSSVALALIPK